MLALLILAAAAAPPPVDRGTACARLAMTDPARAIPEANAWRLVGGGVAARQCLGLAYALDERWASAATAFEQAAREAEANRDGRATDYWIQAGNATLAAGNPSGARRQLDAALATAVLSEAMRGEALLDRARADVALSDLPAARGDLNKALALVAGDPMAWLLSATLARREEDLTRAGADIAQAVRLAPEDPDVALEQGNVAALGGDIAAARVAWTRAALRGAGLPSGQSAKAALTANADSAAAPADDAAKR